VAFKVFVVVLELPNCMWLQEKCSNMMDRASNAAQSAQDSMQEVLYIKQIFSKVRYYIVIEP